MGKEARETIAIFGGSFDPPHKAHQSIVSRAVEILDIERLIVVPAYLNPFKKESLATPDQRLEWCQTIFESEPKVTVSDYEILQGKSTYTADTVKHFQKLYDVKYLIIGSDNLASLTKWYEYAWLNEAITWAVATRKGSEFDTSILRDWVEIELDITISSTHIRDTQTLDTVDNRIVNSVKQVLEKRKEENKG